MAVVGRGYPEQQVLETYPGESKLFAFAPLPTGRSLLKVLVDEADQTVLGAEAG